MRSASNSARISADVDADVEVEFKGDRPDLIDGVVTPELGALSVFLLCFFRYGALRSGPFRRAFRGCGNSP
jgi:hypothetical protein